MNEQNTPGKAMKPQSTDRGGWHVSAERWTMIVASLVLNGCLLLGDLPMDAVEEIHDFINARRDAKDEALHVKGLISTAAPDVLKIQVADELRRVFMNMRSRNVIDGESLITLLQAIDVALPDERAAPAEEVKEWR